MHPHRLAVAEGARQVAAWKRRDTRFVGEYRIDRDDEQLEQVTERAREVWGDVAARIWMESSNVFLGGARPVDVARLEGPERVLGTLAAEAWGGGA